MISEVIVCILYKSVLHFHRLNNYNLSHLYDEIGVSENSLKASVTLPQINSDKYCATDTLASFKNSFLRRREKIEANMK